MRAISCKITFIFIVIGLTLSNAKPMHYDSDEIDSIRRNVYDEYLKNTQDDIVVKTLDSSSDVLDMNNIKYDISNADGEKSAESSSSEKDMLESEEIFPSERDNAKNLELLNYFEYHDDDGNDDPKEFLKTAVTEGISEEVAALEGFDNQENNDDNSNDEEKNLIQFDQDDDENNYTEENDDDNTDNDNNDDNNDDNNEDENDDNNDDDNNDGSNEDGNYANNDDDNDAKKDEDDNNDDNENNDDDDNNNSTVNDDDDDQKLNKSSEEKETRTTFSEKDFEEFMAFYISLHHNRDQDYDYSNIDDEITADIAKEDYNYFDVDREDVISGLSDDDNDDSAAADDDDNDTAADDDNDTTAVAEDDDDDDNNNDYINTDDNGENLKLLVEKMEQSSLAQQLNYNDGNDNNIDNDNDDDNDDSTEYQAYDDLNEYGVKRHHSDVEDSNENVDNDDEDKNDDNDDDNDDDNNNNQDDDNEKQKSYEKVITSLEKLLRQEIQSKAQEAAIQNLIKEFINDDADAADDNDNDDDDDKQRANTDYNKQQQTDMIQALKDILQLTRNSNVGTIIPYAYHPRYYAPQNIDTSDNILLALQKTQHKLNAAIRELIAVEEHMVNSVVRREIFEENPFDGTAFMDYLRTKEILNQLEGTMMELNNINRKSHSKSFTKHYEIFLGSL